MNVGLKRQILVLVVGGHGTNHGHAQLTSEVSCGGRMIGVSVGAQNVGDAAIACFQDVLNVLVDRGTGVDYRQVFSADNVGIGSWPGHNTRVWRH